MPFNAAPDLPQAPEPPCDARPTVLEYAQAVVGPPVATASGHAPQQLQLDPPEQAPGLAQPNVAPPPPAGMPRQRVVNPPPPPPAPGVAQLAEAVQNLRLDITRVEVQNLGLSAEVHALHEFMVEVNQQQRQCNATLTALAAAIAGIRNLITAHGSVAAQAQAQAQPAQPGGPQGQIPQGQGQVSQGQLLPSQGLSVSSQEDTAEWECADEEVPTWQDLRSGRQALHGGRLRGGQTTVSGG